MAEKEKVTLMLLKVDLQCSKCLKKVKKVLRQFPQIQDQMYDEKNNTVMIKVVCCSPEKIRDKICYKGKGSIKSIEILKPPETKPENKPADKPKDQKPANPPKASEQTPLPKAPEQQLPMGYPPCYPLVPGRTYCSDCYEWHSGGLCYDDQYYGQPVRYYDGYYGRPVYDSWGGGGGYGYRGYSGSRCSEYFREENSQVCTIM
ncbi:hypothetical protein ACOSQ2_016128 [Xanthoceras sorbifolium]